MKKYLSKFFLVIFLSGIFLQSCDTPAENVEDAQEDVKTANENLDKANEAYRQDMIEFRAQNAERIASNKKTMTEFHARIASEKSEAKADYAAKIEALDRKNSDMEKKMDDFKTDNESEWGNFKRDFSRDMDVLRDSLQSLFGKDAK